MANIDQAPCRLCLVTPPNYSVPAFLPHLAAALDAGDVASLIVTAPANDPASLKHAAESIVPLAAEHGTATLIHNDARIAAYAKADGVHVDSSPEALAEAIAARGRDRRIVGAGNLRSRHEALQAGELDPDYVFFGRLDGDTGAEIFPKALELAAWWSAVTIIPAVVMGGRTPQSVTEAAARGIAFVALSRAVWEHPRGPGIAIVEAVNALAGIQEPVA